MSRDPNRLLGRALARMAAPAEILSARDRPWSSITFTGARHWFSLRLDGPDAVSRAHAIVADIGENEFAIDGHLVADIIARCVGSTQDHAEIEIEALTVEAR